MKINKIIVGLLFLSISLFGIDKIEMYTENWAPYNFKKDGKVTGIAIDILAKMLKNVKSSQTVADVKLTSWARAYSIAQKKKNAVVFTTTRTEKREKMFKWVGPIDVNQVVAIAPKSKSIKISSATDLNKYKVGAIFKDVGESVLKSSGIKKIQSTKGLNARDLSLKKLMAGKIDIFSISKSLVVDVPSIGFKKDDYEVVYVLNESSLSYAFNKDTDDALIAKFQKALDALKADGTVDKLNKKYK